MEKQIFKTGDKVFVYGLGWGVVNRYSGEGSIVFVSNNIGYIVREESVSFTEYTLQNFSQERPINYEKYIGKWGAFKKLTETKAIGKLRRYNPNKLYSFLMENGVEYTRFEPLTEEQLKALNLKNE